MTTLAYTIFFIFFVVNFIFGMFNIGRREEMTPGGALALFLFYAALTWALVEINPSPLTYVVVLGWFVYNMVTACFKIGGEIVLTRLDVVVSFVMYTLIAVLLLTT